MAKRLPRNYIVKGGGDWLDIDYSNIDFDHAGVSPTRTDDGYLVHADEKTPSGILDPDQVTLEIGRGFETKEAAEAELRRLREFVESLSA
jgi:hypothetical protein